MNSLIKSNFSKVNTIFFSGIGGIGMSGLAAIFKTLGYNVKGSDIKENNNIISLRKQGIEITIGQKASNLFGSDILVVSSAIKPNNPEYIEALEQGIPIFKRAQMLAELMRFKIGIAVSGTHGKTTTTSLLSQILNYAQFDPTAVIGGIVNSWGNNTRIGKSDWLVTEADESDGSFIDLPAVISIVTNIEAEHMDYYEDYNSLKNHFINFINKIPFYGFSVLCIDSKGVQDILPSLRQRHIIVYGESPQADYRVVNIRYTPYGTYFDIHCNIKGKEREIKDFYLPMSGTHNVLNAASAIAVADNIGISIDEIKEGICNFEGVKRRFSLISEYNNTKFIDDYAHHPSEISAVIDAARHIIGDQGSLISVIQPHKYSRLKDQFEGYCQCVNGSEYVLVMDVYSAGEDEIESYNAKSLVKGIKDHGHKNALYIENEEDLYRKIKDLMMTDKIDMVLFMGAGDITFTAQRISDIMIHDQKEIFMEKKNIC